MSINNLIYHWLQIFYPYNHYRNIALERAHTSHVFVSDIDLVPSEGLEERALKHFQSGAVSGNKVSIQAL